jgi:hypothetical protein
MITLQVKYEDQKIIVRDKDAIYGWIIFDENNIEATLQVTGKALKAVRGDDKNIILKQDDASLFTFKFDYLWGGAELVVDGVDTGYDIKGRWFKPGTRLTDENDKDLVIAVKQGNGLEVTITDVDISPVMVMATIYYHIYTSGSKARSVSMAGFG